MFSPRLFLFLLMRRNILLLTLVCVVVALAVWQMRLLGHQSPRSPESQVVPEVAKETDGTNGKAAGQAPVLPASAEMPATAIVTGSTTARVEQWTPLLLPGEHDRLPLLRSDLSQAEASREISNAWNEARSCSPGTPFCEYRAGVTRRMIGEFLERWPGHEDRVHLLQVRLLAGERIANIAHGVDLWAWATAAALDRGKNPEDLAETVEIARERIRRVQGDRQEALALEYSNSLRAVVTGTQADAILLLESGVALCQLKDYNHARDAFAKAAKTGSGMVRHNALTLLLGIANQWMWLGDMFEAADGLLADPELTHEERASALCSRANALLLMSEPEKSLRDAREVLARYGDTQYASQARDLIQHAEGKLKAGNVDKDKNGNQGVTLTPAATPSF